MGVQTADRQGSVQVHQGDDGVLAGVQRVCADPYGRPRGGAGAGVAVTDRSWLGRVTDPFDWRLGNTLTRGFAGEAGGQQVVVFVAKEGPYQGRVLSAIVPDANQMAQWGFP